MVRPRSVRAITVFVGGEVANPGNYDVTSTMTVAELVREAGGPTATGDPDTVTWLHGGTESKVIKANDLSFHPGDGDRVVVAKRAPDMSISVSGGVKHPGMVAVYAGSKLSDLIERAGGLERGADASRVKISSPDQATASVVDFDAIDKGYTGDFILKPGMKVEVPSRHSLGNDQTIKYAAGAAVLLFLLGR